MSTNINGGGVMNRLRGKVGEMRQALANEVADVVTGIRIPGATKPSLGGTADLFPKNVFEPAAANAAGKTLSHAELAQQFATIKARAVELAGAPGDIAQRVRQMHAMFTDSGGNHAFPMVALHGALAAKTYFDSADLVIDKVFSRLGDVQAMRDFSTAMKATNRQVFIDSYTNYFFSKHFGTQPNAEDFVQPKLLVLLNQMHAVNLSGRQLAPEAKRELFHMALLTEQEQSVSSAVDAAANAFPFEFLEDIAFSPDLAFEYFPEGEALTFTDFQSTDQRVTAAMKAYDLAAAAGWDKVESSMRGYGVLSDAYFDGK